MLLQQLFYFCGQISCRKRNGKKDTNYIAYFKAFKVSSRNQIHHYIKNHHHTKLKKRTS